jgi:hypothetical protein
MFAAGVYTVWAGEQLVHVGMTGRAMRQEDIAAACASPTSGPLHIRLALREDFVTGQVADLFAPPSLPEKSPHESTGRAPAHKPTMCALYPQ